MRGGSVIQDDTRNIDKNIVLAGLDLNINN